MPRLKPLFDRLLVMLDQRETKTKSGITLIETRNQEMAQYGVVVEVSDKTKKFFKPGDYVAFRKYSGVEFPITDRDTLRETCKLVMLKLEEVLCVVDRDAEVPQPVQAPAPQTSLLVDENERPI